MIPKFTLVHFLVNLLEEKYADLKDFAEDIKDCTPASKVSFPTIEADINNLKKGLQVIENAVAKVQAYESSADKFKEIMTEYNSRAKEDFSVLERDLSETQKNFGEILEFFGEDPKTTPEEFFKIWAAFIQTYQKAKDENEKAVEAEKKRAKREAGQASKKQQNTNKEAGLVDGLLSNLAVRKPKRDANEPHEEAPQEDNKDVSPKISPRGEDVTSAAPKPTPKQGMAAGVAEEALTAFNSLQKKPATAKKPAGKGPSLDLADEALSAFTQMKKPAKKASTPAATPTLAQDQPSSEVPAIAVTDPKTN